MRGIRHKLKPAAVQLRKKGLSIRKIERRLRISRSTLSGWFKTIILSQKQKEKLRNDWENALVRARGQAVLWHNAQKEKRLQDAKTKAIETIERINTSNRDIIELALAILYFGEGSKKNVETGLGSSDPLILRFFVNVLMEIYLLDIKQMRCELYLRADQNPEKTKRFWSRELRLPLGNFRQVNIDKRTAGSKTYDEYHGVCSIRCGNVAIQRKLVFLAKEFFQRITIKGS